MNKSEIIIYNTEDGKSRIQVRLEDGTVWLSQKLIAELFQVAVHTVNEHIKNIYAEGEVPNEATIRNFRIVQKEGSREVARDVEFYNLDLIMAVGYRVRSERGIQFRRWATERLKEYIVKGFVIDNERLKEPGGLDYFDDLLEQIRDIRASEKRFYQKIRDIYKLSIDYRPDAEETHEFFQIVQNKLHWAVAGHTAAEIIHGRANANKPNMGLTSWKGSKVRRGDVTVAKNYLVGDEIKQLNKIVNMYLDYAEEQARRRKVLYMKDWREKLDGFLKFHEHEILKDAGRVSMEVAQNLALAEYDKFNAHRIALEADAENELEKQVKRIEHKSRKPKKKGNED
ncbi:MAG: hydroxyacid dehydrogenase [Elusimicrobia bacterium RIFOXYA12_FULL_51_18]|nr:MAG: hydroxyacid dehydrogenase [Elusimicrobia bacterium RIFOXYA12_FULL_51_18]OGS31289.1 MAG: hydroxyacid dehydrogenase [Elusimicrobia bacterium RIFOXYA2_FULL_53_38]